MGNPLMRVSRGMPVEFSAEWYNLVCRTVEAFLDSRGGKVGGASMDSQATFERVWIRNDSGSNRDKFDILGIDDGFANYAAEASEEEPDEEVLEDQLVDFRDQPVLIGVAPNEEDHTGRFVILQEAVAIGEIGLALVAGASLVQVDVSDEEHDHADVYDGEPTKLKSGSSGLVRIISKPSGTGVKWALVAYGGGGGECDCPDYWYQITYTGQASSSTFQLIITIAGASGSPWTLNVPYNQSPSGLQTQIEAVGPFASSPADYKVAVHSDDNGSLPANTLNLTFSIPASETLAARRGMNSSNAFVFVTNMKKPEV